MRLKSFPLDMSLSYNTPVTYGQTDGRQPYHRHLQHSSRASKSKRC